MKFCVNCKWCELETSYLYERDQLKFSRCDNPKNLIYTVDLVSGQDIVRRKQPLCSTQRLLGWFITREFGRCGKEGRWYERSNL